MIKRAGDSPFCFADDKKRQSHPQITQINADLKTNNSHLSSDVVQPVTE
jgi:hypothetical protein